ncbi:MAG: CRISPR-associated protein Cas4 [Chloroflexi bacterium]|nr:CRISPR-associated protein Cas4 [Chloroflexota bacterium]MBP8059318.1 CRISPR-associated protein Cas4 [Chloroflexota bacterium]
MDSTWIIILGCLLLAAAAWFRANRMWANTGLPDGKVVYEDVIHTENGDWYPQQKPLYSQNLQLVGRPDYLVRERDGSLTPVEVKSSQAPNEPHEGHVLQLAAYCLLVTENYGVRPRYGIIQYRNRAFAVEFTDDLEDDLLDLLVEMREALYADELDRDHNDWRRCGRCSVRGQCVQRLA